MAIYNTKITTKLILLSIIISSIFTLSLKSDDNCLKVDETCVNTKYHCCEGLGCMYVGKSGKMYVCDNFELKETKKISLVFLSQEEKENPVEPLVRGGDDDCLKVDETCVNTKRFCCEGLSCMYVTKSGMMYGCDNLDFSK